MLGVEQTVIESVELETDGHGQEVLVARVRVKAGAARRCSRCGRRCPGYDTSQDPRRWRGLDLGTIQVFLQATTSRVSCREHGVVVAAVPWSRPGSRFTTAFEDTAAWLVCHATLSVVAMLLRVAWRSVAGACHDLRVSHGWTKIDRCDRHCGREGHPREQDPARLGG